MKENKERKYGISKSTTDCSKVTEDFLKEVINDIKSGNLDNAIKSEIKGWVMDSNGMFPIEDNQRFKEYMEERKNDTPANVINNNLEIKKNETLMVNLEDIPTELELKNLNLGSIKKELNNSKYYTPSIEEFYEGFEYELRQGDTWYQQKFNMNQSIKGRVLTELVRVPYLSKSDIESCGFIADNNCIFTCTKKLGDDYDIKLSLNPYSDEPDILIWLVLEDRKEITCFNGIVKNLSELKKLLKQLGLNKQLGV